MNFRPTHRPGQKLRKLGNLNVLFLTFSLPAFQFWPNTQNRILGRRKLWKKFWAFQVFNLPLFKSLCLLYFLPNFYFSPNNSPSKTKKNFKNFFISSKKLFSFLRYLDFCIFVFSSFFPCQPLLYRLIQEKS